MKGRTWLFVKLLKLKVTLQAYDFMKNVNVKKSCLDSPSEEEEDNPDMEC